MNEGVNIPPRGQRSPPGAKFTPRGKLHTWGLTHVVKKWPLDGHIRYVDFSSANLVKYAFWIILKSLMKTFNFFYF
jgi:hypothetical protein